MRILIVDNPCRPTPFSTVAADYYKKMAAIAGTWQEVETEFLFQDQFNIKELRIYARDVEAIEGDLRSGSYKSMHSGKVYRTYDTIPENERDVISQFRPVSSAGIALRLEPIPENEEAIAVAEALRKELQTPQDHTGDTEYQALKIVFPRSRATQVIEGLADALGLTPNQKNYAKVAISARRAFTCDELSFCHPSDSATPRPSAFDEIKAANLRTQVRNATKGLVREWNKHHSRHAMQVDNVAAAHHLLRMLTVGRDPETEHLAALFLDAAGKIQGWHVWDGSQRSITVSASDLVRKALEGHAVKIVLGHNHPSGSTKPSEADIELTKTAAQACDILGMALVDHLIVGACEDQWTSMWAEGLINNHPSDTEDE